jgi:hypothetical protein
MPMSPLAKRPFTGPARTTPRRRRASTFSTVAGCSHMRLCIAGASTSGTVVARTVMLTTSSARPCASLAMKLAVAGITRRASAQSESAMWTSPPSRLGLVWVPKRSLATGWPERASKVNGETNRVASGVIATRTSAPAWTNRLTVSAHL